MATIDKMVGKEGVIYKARIRISGYPTQIKHFKKITEAKAWVLQVETSIHKGEFVSVLKTAKTKTLGDVIQRYKSDILPHKALSTQRVEQSYIKYWDSQFGNYALTYLTPELIEKKLKELREKGDTRSKIKDAEKTAPPKPMAKQTMKHYRDHLEKFLNHAHQWGWMGANPVNKVQRVIKLNNARVRYLSDKEREKLLKACQQSLNPQLYPMVIFALSTGARLGEIMNLGLDDVDLKKQKAILRETKNGETRVIPIVGHLNKILNQQITYALSHYNDNHVGKMFLFPRSDGLAAMDMRSSWRTARKTAGLHDFRFHDLRHSAASYLAMNGATLLEIAAVLGHKTLDMVKRYSHLSESHTAGIVSKMNNKIFK